MPHTQYSNKKFCTVDLAFLRTYMNNNYVFHLTLGNVHLYTRAMTMKKKSLPSRLLINRQKRYQRIVDLPQLVIFFFFLSFRAGV